jgi:hypothetical protein
MAGLTCAHWFSMHTMHLTHSHMHVFYENTIQGNSISSIGVSSQYKTQHSGICWSFQPWGQDFGCLPRCFYCWSQLSHILSQKGGCWPFHQRQSRVVYRFSTSASVDVDGGHIPWQQPHDIWCSPLCLGLAVNESKRANLEISNLYENFSSSLSGCCHK